MSKYNNFTLSIVFVLLLVITISGSTFAYFSASTTGNGDNISGGTSNFKVELTIENMRDGNLIPVADDLIDETVNNDYLCEDIRGYSLCNFYKIKIKNKGDSEILYGNLKTISSTYETTNLKFQLYTRNNDIYTAISDMIVIDHSTNSENNFVLNDEEISFTLADGNTTNQVYVYYLAIWMSDPDNNQLIDQDKAYEGKIIFNGADGGIVSTNFTQVSPGGFTLLPSNSSSSVGGGQFGDS